MRYQPEQTRAEIIRLIKTTVDFYEAKKTLDFDGILFTAETIINNNMTTTLEELRMVCDGIKTGKFGKLYERLKTEQFIDCLNRSEGQRVHFLEGRHKEHDKVTKDIDVTKITYKPTTMQDLRRKEAAPIFELAKHIAETQRNKQQDNDPND